MLLFVHGFGSCGWGAKSLLLRSRYGIAALLAPDLPLQPDRALERLRDIVARYPVRALIGSSLGGFYATALGAEMPLPAILVNPVVRPHALLARYRGEQRRWCDGAPLHVDDGYIDTLRRLYRPTLPANEHYLVLLQTGDETLDHRDAEAYYASKDLVLIEGGSHRFERLDRCLPLIDGWLEQFDGAAGDTMVPPLRAPRRDAGESSL